MVLVVEALIGAPAGTAPLLVVSIRKFPAKERVSNVTGLPAVKRFQMAVMLLPGSPEIPPEARVLLEVAVPKKAVP